MASAASQNAISSGCQRARAASRPWLRDSSGLGRMVAVTLIAPIARENRPCGRQISTTIMMV